MEWQSIESAPDGVEIMTKIHDGQGLRNEQSLTKSGNLWYFPDMSMYVYYKPTHWKPMTAPRDSVKEPHATEAKDI